MTPEQTDINRRIIEAATYDTDQARHAVGQVLDNFIEEIDRLKEDVRVAREAARLLGKNEEDIFKKLDAAKEENRKLREAGAPATTFLEGEKP